VAAVRTTSQRGVSIVATAHGVDLRSLISNPELNPLLGGVEVVTLGDVVARKENRGVKTRSERKGAPAFAAAVEVLAVDR
jgi:stage III sporulation protein SpoIIIAA